MRELVADLVAEGVEATIKPEIREVVEATVRLLAEVRQGDLKAALNLDKSAISRRAAGALDGGFLKNLEDRKGRPARLVLGDPLPASREVLPTPDHLIDSDRLRGCAVGLGGRTAPAPSATKTDATGATDLECETTASDGHCTIVPVDPPLPLAAHDAIIGKASRCVQCGKDGADLYASYGGSAQSWLHRSCEAAWKASFDNFDLNRRSELDVGTGTTPDMGATNGGHL